MTPVVLARATEPFPRRVGTLDAIHLASMLYLKGCGDALTLASYDDRLNEAAHSVGVELAALCR